LPPPTALADRSTLTILRGDGRYSEQARAPAIAAVDGQDVAVGDRVITGSDSNLILTFFEGSTFTLTPNTDIVIQRLQGSPASRDISLRLNVGTIWARVVSFGSSSATFQVQTPSATAVVRGSQIGARVLPDGTFQCWTREGQMSVSTASGQQVSLNPGETVLVQPGGQVAGTRVFTPASSVLRFRTEGAVWPLLVHPDGGANGVVDPGVVVSQTFGAFVASPHMADTVQQFEVPASDDGRYLLVLEGRAGAGLGDYALKATGLMVQLYSGSDNASEEVVEDLELRGQIAAGERIAFAYEVRVDNSGRQDARLQSFVMSGPLPVDGALGPAKVLVSPVELSLAGLAGP
jgi:hypothetical protein